MFPQRLRACLLLFIALCMLPTMGCRKGDLLAPGAALPDVAVPNQEGIITSLSSFRGAPLLVYFYPKDDTPGCTKEACALRDAWDRYEQAGIQVIGVSADSVESHRKFMEKHALPFPLLSDPDGRLAEAFGVSRVMGMFSRVSFLADDAGIIRATYPKVDPALHADEVLRDAEQKRLVAPQHERLAR